MRCSPRLAPALRDAGLDRVNISLDTLDPVRFSQITRLGRVEQALAGIDAALAYGFEPVKVNTVVVRRMNQDVLQLAKLSLDRPVHVRFIEYMPIGSPAVTSRPSNDGHRTEGARAQLSGQSGANGAAIPASASAAPCPPSANPHCGAGTSGVTGALNPDLWDEAISCPPTSCARRSPPRRRPRA